MSGVHGPLGPVGVHGPLGPVEIPDPAVDDYREMHRLRNDIFSKADELIYKKGVKATSDERSRNIALLERILQMIREASR